MLTQSAYDAPTTVVQCLSLQSEAKTYENTRVIACPAFLTKLKRSASHLGVFPTKPNEL